MEAKLNSQDLLFHSSNTSLSDYFHGSNQVLFNSKSLVQLDTILYNLTEDAHKKASENSLLFIKTSLGNDYLSFHGLRLAYHIRLSEHEKLAQLPIIFVSSEPIDQLLKLTQWAGILSTKSVYLIDESESSYTEIVNQRNNLKFSKVEDPKEEIKSLNIKPPSNLDTSHNLTNALALSNWANYLSSPEIAISIREKVGEDIFFKLQTLAYSNSAKFNPNTRIPLPQGSKILVLDDESELGWKYVFKEVFDIGTIIEFLPIHKEQSKNSIIDDCLNAIDSINPDCILLDLRLHNSDHDISSPKEELTGVKLLQKIKSINSGISVMAFTASKDTEVTRMLLTPELDDHFPVNEFLSKSLQPNELRESFRDSIKKAVGKTKFIKPYISRLDKLITKNRSASFANMNTVEARKFLELSKLSLMNKAINQQYNIAFIFLYKALEAVRGELHQHYSSLIPITGTNTSERRSYERIFVINGEPINNRIKQDLNDLYEYRNDYIHSNNPVRGDVAIIKDIDIQKDTSNSKSGRKNKQEFDRMYSMMLTLLEKVI
jgi:CheY-like chemotaxis protein